MTEEEKKCEEVPTPQEEPAEQAAEPEKNGKEKKSEIKRLKGELERSNRELEELRAKNAETEDKYLRVCAEYDNFRKRTQAERKQAYTDAVSDTLKGILPILDNLQIAQKYADGEAEKVAEGVNMILSKLPETLEKLNVQAFGAVGEQFDPGLHNAVMHVEDEERGEGEIVEVLQCGYRYGDKVIRYAMVKVAN